MRVVFVCIALAVFACSEKKPTMAPAGPAATPAPAPAAPPAAEPPPPSALPSISPPTAPTPATWQLPLPPAGLKALDTFVGFSSDGLLFAYTEYSAGAGLPVLSFIATTTNTTEKTIPLDSQQTREKVATELHEEAFPKPGALPAVPDVIGAIVHEGEVFVTFSGMPATKGFKPFDGVGIVPGKVEVVAVSTDGKLAAVRVGSKGSVGEFGPASHYRVVKLFQ